MEARSGNRPRFLLGVLAVADLRAKLAEAGRPELLRYVARAIHGFTIMARDPDLSGQAKAVINNRIHYLAGHLVGLADPAEPLTPSRLDGILEQIAWLDTGLAQECEADLGRSPR